MSAENGIPAEQQGTINGFYELSKVKPKNGQMCFCLVRCKSRTKVDQFYTHLAKYLDNTKSFFTRDDDSDFMKLYNVELWKTCDVDYDGILCDEFYGIEEYDLKENRYLSKRTQPK